MRRFLLRLLRTYILLLVVIFFGQRWLIYHPTKATDAEMTAMGKADGLVPWRNQAGEIAGWRRDAARALKPANKLIVFHGNAGNAIHREPYIAGFESLEDGRLWEVFIFEYPGYGARGGKPSRQSINYAGHEAVKDLITMDDRPVFVLGESIGSGVACEVAMLEPKRVKGVAVVTPFARLSEVAQRAIPFVPAGLLLRDRWDNVATLQQSRLPVAVVIAGRDEVIGSEQGEQLYSSLGDRPKQRWLFPQATHNTLEFSPLATWWSEVSLFLIRSSNGSPAE